MTADISALDIGDSIHVADLKATEGVRILEGLEMVVALVVAPEKEEEAVPVEAAPPQPEMVGRKEGKEEKGKEEKE
jgi:large subunit ribosomal protein L25